MLPVDQFRALPKAELHQHLDGSVRPATAVELAADIGIPMTLDEARSRMVGPVRCRDQAELLGFFDLPIALLQTAEALERVTAELVADLMADGIRYAEVRWAPRLHLERGLSVPDVLEAVVRGVSRAAATHGPRTPLVALLVTAMRSIPPAPTWRWPRRPPPSGRRSLASTSPAGSRVAPRPRMPSPSPPRVPAGWR